jgi:hypothetical protein
MKSIMVAAAFLALLVTSSVHAQLTGPSTLGLLRDDLAKQTNFKVELATNGVTLKDAKTGREIFTVRQVSSQTVTLSGVVASLDKVAPAQRQEVLRRIALFNFSSPVGTLEVDNSGKVTMYHHLSSRLVSRAGMVDVASRFGDAMREEAKVLLQ